MLSSFKILQLSSFHYSYWMQEHNCRTLFPESMILRDKTHPLRYPRFSETPIHTETTRYIVFHKSIKPICTRMRGYWMTPNNQWKQTFACTSSLVIDCELIYSLSGHSLASCFYMYLCFGETWILKKTSRTLSHVRLFPGEEGMLSNKGIDSLWTGMTIIERRSIIARNPQLLGCFMMTQFVISGFYSVFERSR